MTNPISLSETNRGSFDRSTVPTHQVNNPRENSQRSQIGNSGNLSQNSRLHSIEPHDQQRGLSTRLGTQISDQLSSAKKSIRARGVLAAIGVIATFTAAAVITCVTLGSLPAALALGGAGLALGIAVYSSLRERPLPGATDTSTHSRSENSQRTATTIISTDSVSSVASVGSVASVSSVSNAGYPNTTGNNCFVASTLQNLSRRQDIKRIIETGIYPADKPTGAEDIAIADLTLQLIAGRETLSDQDKSQLLFDLNNALEEKFGDREDIELNFSQQNDPHELINTLLESLGLTKQLPEITQLQKMDKETPDFELTEQSNAQLRRQRPTQSVALLNCPIPKVSNKEGVFSTRELVQSYFAETDIEMKDDNGVDRTGKKGMLLDDPEATQLALQIKRTDIQHRSWRWSPIPVKNTTPINLLTPCNVKIPFRNPNYGVEGTQQSGQPVIRVVKRLTPQLINVHIGINPGRGHHIAYDVEPEQSGHMKITELNDSYAGPPRNPTKPNILIQKNACMALFKMEDALAPNI